jgi:predicted phosphodiesterase
MRGLVGRAVASCALLAAAGCGSGGGTSPSPVPTPAEAPSSSAYLQDVSTTAAALCHYSAEADAYGGEWSLASGGGVVGRAQEAAATRTHALRLAPLAPDTSYSYRLRTSAGALLAEGRFSTPPAARARPVTFAVVSDSGWPNGSEAQVAEAIRTSSPTPEMLVHGGDVIYPHGERENYWPNLFTPFARVLDHVPLFAAIGNHDCETENGQPWLDMFTTPANGPVASERYYSFDWGDVHVLVLDVVSTDFGHGGRQWSFADADLAASTSWKVAVLHYPPYSAGPSGGNDEVRRELQPVFEARQVDVVFSGHDHGYQRFAVRRGVHYVVSGGGGAPPDPIRGVPELASFRSVCHCVRGRADATSLQLEAIGTDGVVFESLVLRR